ncbi:MAG: hypothetical protein ACOY94_25195 [Bacillota bacterium]
MQRTLLLLASGILLIGCSSSGTDVQGDAKPVPAPAPKEPVAQTATPEPSTSGQAAKPPAKEPGTEVTQREIDTAESVLLLYFDAVVNQDTAMMSFLSAGNPAPKKPSGPTGSKTATIEEIKLLKATVIEETPTVYFEVKVDLGSSPGGAWNPGINHRWAELQKISDVWKVKALTSTPPSL